MRQYNRRKKKNWRKILSFLLAAALWAEGTLGSAYAAEAAVLAEPVQTAGGEDDRSASDSGSESEEEKAEMTPGQTQEAEDGDASEEDEPAEGENVAPGEEEGPDSGENAQPGGEDADSGENARPGGEDADSGENARPGGEDADSGENAQPGEEEPAETVSDNTLTDEDGALEAGDADVEDALGEPPLMADAAGGYAAYSDSGMSLAAAESRHQTPGVADIIDRYKAYPWSLDVPNSYSVEPSVKAPYAPGYLRDECLDNALHLLNFIRYVAGVPADVTLNEDYMEKAQAGALLSRVNGRLEDNQKKPDGFPEELYELGKAGYAESNMAAGYNSSIANSLLNGWIYSGDSSRIDRMAHRRWALNPSMTQTGFGAVGAYSAMYALDRKGGGISDYVAWPAQNMPIELMNGSGTPWTLSLGSDYGKASFQDVNVTLKDITNNKSWTFSGSKANGAFKVNVEYYGMPNCIIFRPNNVSYNKNSQFQVTVSGIKLKSGEDTTITYNVDFFSLEEEPAEVGEIVLNTDTLHLLKGVEGKQEDTLSATVKPGNARDKKLVWKSKDESVATVDGSGKVTAVGVGTTEVSATAANGVQGVCTVKVSDYFLWSDADGFLAEEETGDCSLSFDLTMNAKPGRLTVMDGDPAENGAAAEDDIRWISENESVVMVDSDGSVTPLAVGDALIWADVDNGFAVLKCRVKVEDSKLPQIELREKAYTLDIRTDAAGNRQRESRQLQLYFTPSDSKWVNRGSSYVKWTSSDPAAAAFTADGVPGGTQRTDEGEGSDTETGPDVLAETVSGNTVTVTAVGAGETKISAVIVNEEGNPVTDSDGKTAETSCTVTVRAEAETADQDIPRPIALTNTQTVLRDVALPEGWSWEQPDTALAQFSGGKTKKFAALYRPADAGENILPARRFLEVCFLTVENISMGVRADDGTGLENAVLSTGQNAECYVNYSFSDALEQLENSDAYKKNGWFKKQKAEILKELGEMTIWSNSRTDVLSMERTAGGVKLAAKSAGSATVKASLKFGRKTYNASVKLTVKETGGTLTVKDVEHFTRVSGTDGGTERAALKYTGLLSDFQTEKANQVNSKITLTLPGATKVTAKSGNAKVVAVKSSAAADDGFVVSLIVKAAGTAEITLTGNDAGKTSRTIRLAVGDAEPGISEESVTLNLMQTTGVGITLYPAKDPEGKPYEITNAALGTDADSAKFKLVKGTADSHTIKAKSGTKTGTYRIKLRAAAGGKTYDLPLTVKVVSKNPVYKVSQERKLNLFYKEEESLLRIDTDETLTRLECTGLADYSIIKKDGRYYIKADKNATLKSVKKGKLQLFFAGWQGSYTASFTAGVEKKAPKLTWDTGKVTLYPKAGVQSLWIGTKNPEAISWDTVKVERRSGTAKGNYTVDVDREKGCLLLSGKNLNQADSFKMQILLSDTDKWAQKETVSYTLQVKVNMGQPAIALENKTLQLNADEAYRGYDAVSTAVKWKDGGRFSADQGVRVSVYCDAKDKKAKALVQNGQVVFSVKNARVFVRLNNKAVEAGTYKFIVQAAKDGQIWKTPLALKVVNTAPDKAVRMAAKGSIDVLNRSGSFMTLTPSLKAVNGTFVVPEGREVKLAGRDAHLFRAEWSADGKTIELRARENETLVIKYQYTVTPLLTLKNVNGETEQISAPAVKLKVKQGSVKVTAWPKTALMYSGAYNSVEIDMNAVLKGAAAPEIESVVLSGNTDAFAYVYNKDGKGTLTMKDTGSAVKGRTYSLQFKVFFAEQADNVKPVTVRCKVKVK